MITRSTRYYLSIGGLLVFLALSACKQIPTAIVSTPPSVQDTRQFVVRQTLVLHNHGTGQPEKQNLWVALIRDLSPYQKVDFRKVSPSNYTLVIDEYENEYAEFDFSDHPPGEDIVVEIEYKISVNELTYELENCKGISPDVFTQPELRIESANPQVVALSKDLVQGTENDCERVRAFYDFVADELVYTYNRKDWGAQATFGPMGADCTEYSSLVIALSRAAGIPARYFEGLLYLEDETTGFAQTEHAWLDVYLPGVGWTPADPTLGRSAIFRETHFAHYTPEHIIVTIGRNPSTLRGASYWSHLYWPGDSTEIQVKAADWQITPSD